MKEIRKSFILYTSFYRPIESLSDAQLGRLLRVIFEYQLGEMPEVGRDIAMAFEFIKAQFEADEQKYQRKVETNRENGRRGGAPKGNKNALRIAGQECDEGGVAGETDEVEKTTETTERLKNNRNNPKQPKTTENNRKQRDNDDDDDDEDDDDDTQECVCGDVARTRAEHTNTTPHTDFDFFFPVFWKRNVWNPAEETHRFIDHYEVSEWTLEKGTVLKTDAQRLAKARVWSPKKEGDRFPKQFLQPWLQLAEKAPPEVRAEMLDDRVEVSTREAAPRILCGRRTVAWFRGDGLSEFRRLIMVGWLKDGPFNVNVRF